MKTNKIIAAVVALGALAACNSPKPIVVDGQTYTLPKQSVVDSVSYLLGVNYGSFLKGYDFGENLNFAQMEKGMKDFLNAKGNPQDEEFVKNFKIDPNLINDMFNAYLEQRGQYTAAQNKLDEKNFLDAAAKKAGVQSTESGLLYNIIEAGDAQKPGPQDTVWVHYKGTLPDGTVFDENAPEDDAIFFPLNGVIAGWTEGLQLIGKGGKINLVIPSALGYGERGNQVIPGNTPLTFDVELVDVHPFVEDAE